MANCRNLALIKTRDMFFLYKFRKEKFSDFYKQFCFYRNKVQKEVKTAKSDFLSNKIEKNKNNPKKLWGQIKSLGYSNKPKSSPNIVLNIDNENSYEDKKIANQCWFRSCHPVLNCSPLLLKNLRIFIKLEIPKVKFLDCIL